MLHYTPNIRSWNIEDCAPWEFCQTGACYGCQNSLEKTWELHILLQILYHGPCYGCQNSLGKTWELHLLLHIVYHGTCLSCHNSLGKTWELHLLLHIFYQMGLWYGCQNSLGKTWELHLLLQILCYGCQNSLGKNMRITPSATYPLYFSLYLSWEFCQTGTCYSCQNSLENMRITPSATYCLSAPPRAPNVTKRHKYTTGPPLPTF